MPHTTPILRRDTADIILMDADVETFRAFLAALVADCFRLHTGEDLKPGTQSRVYEPIMTNSCPVDLVLQIAAWWTPERESKFEAIAQSLKQVLDKGFSAVDAQVQIEVFINAIGAPSSRVHN